MKKAEAFSECSEGQFSGGPGHSVNCWALKTEKLLSSSPSRKSALRKLPIVSKGVASDIECIATCFMKLLNMHCVLGSVPIAYKNFGAIAVCTARIAD